MSNLSWTPPSQDKPPVMPPPAIVLGQPVTVDSPQPRASDHHVAMLCQVAANLPGPDHPTDPERALKGWQANMRLHADQIAAEAFHAGAAWGLALQAPAGRYIVVTEEQYERIQEAGQLSPDLIARSVPAR